MDVPASIAAQAMRTPTIVPVNMRVRSLPGTAEVAVAHFGAKCGVSGPRAAAALAPRRGSRRKLGWLFSVRGLVVFRIRRYVRGRSH